MTTVFLSAYEYMYMWSVAQWLEHLPCKKDTGVRFPSLTNTRGEKIGGTGGPSSQPVN